MGMVIGNWKMNKTPSEAVELIRELRALLGDKTEGVVVCPPFVCIPAVRETLAGSGIGLGAQNMYWEEKGAYTGEISPLMLKELGVGYVIIGHSERRQHFGETDEMVHKKVQTAYRFGLLPIICVGETLEQREKGETKDLLIRQTRAALEGLDAEQAKGLVMAYEPIWAIGTGKTASPEQANDAAGVIRGVIGEMFRAEAGKSAVIVYGGSINSGNAREIFAMPNINGGLPGGASLKPDEFAKIVNALYI